MPAAVGEAAARILVGAAGRLRNSVEGHELIDDDLAHLGGLQAVVPSVQPGFDGAPPRQTVRVNAKPQPHPPFAHAVGLAPIPVATYSHAILALQEEAAALIAGLVLAK